MKHFTFFLFQEITMFHLTCGLLIINEDLQYSSCGFSSLAGNTTSNAMHSWQWWYIAVSTLVFSDLSMCYDRCIVDCLIGALSCVCGWVCWCGCKVHCRRWHTWGGFQKGRRRFFHTLHFYPQKVAFFAYITPKISAPFYFVCYPIHSQIFIAIHTVVCPAAPVPAGRPGGPGPRRKFCPPNQDP